MGVEKKLVYQYELKQKALKKENRRYKKRIPYYIFGFIFFGIGLISLLDGRIDNCVVNGFNLILIVTSIFSVVSIVYLMIIYIKTKKNTTEIKVLGTKIYKLMKL
ncbi:MAG: hypothetical protein JKY44_06560 [Flavobacteriaceae bacterium]|nr:hypothetical protein [Flavobacteriaceae bacterium]